MILIEFEVIQSIEGDLRFSWSFVGHEQSLISQAVFHSWDYGYEPILFSDIFSIKEFVFEEDEKLLSVVCLEQWDSGDQIILCVLTNQLSNQSSRSGFFIFLRCSLYSCSTFLQAYWMNTLSYRFYSISLEKSISLNKSIIVETIISINSLIYEIKSYYLQYQSKLPLRLFICCKFILKCCIQRGSK